ncbi:MAG: hypothetical protein ACHQYP_10595 [Nitrospiria bacterium]
MDNWIHRRLNCFGMKSIRNIATVLLLIALFSWSHMPTSFAADSRLPSSFTIENIMKVHQGMNSKEILQMFGPPKNVRQEECIASGEMRTCTTWEYGFYPVEGASFTFVGDNHDALILDKFNFRNK